MSDRTFPPAHGRLETLEGGLVKVFVACPFCQHVHAHGGWTGEDAGPLPDDDLVRVAHCAGPNSGSYQIVLDD